MNLRVARPDAADLVLRTYGRALHPDLLCHHKSTVMTGPGLELDLRLIAAGHAFILRTATQTLSEVISDRHDASPRRGQLFEQKLRGCRTETVEFETGLRYDVCCTLEQLSLSVFLRLHEEILADGAKASLFAEFPGASRMSPGPLSVVLTELRHRSLTVNAYHTFPQQLVIVKTQSLIEF